VYFPTLCAGTGNPTGKIKTSRMRVRVRVATTYRVVSVFGPVVLTSTSEFVSACPNLNGDAGRHEEFILGRECPTSSGD